MSRALVVHAFNNSTWEAKAARFVSSKPAWSTQWAPGQPGLHREACLGKRNLSRKKKKLSNEHPFPTSEFSRPFKNLFYYYLCVCLLVFFVHACAHVCMHVLRYIEVRGQLSGVGSLLLPCEFWDGTQVVRSVQQVSLSLGILTGSTGPFIFLRQNIETLSREKRPSLRVLVWQPWEAAVHVIQLNQWMVPAQDHSLPHLTGPT